MHSTSQAVCSACFAFWTPASLSLQGGMEQGASSSEQTCRGMFADTSRFQPAPPQAQTLLRCRSLRRRMRLYRTRHSKARGGISLFSSCCCRRLFPPSPSLCCQVCVDPLFLLQTTWHPEVDMDHWLYQTTVCGSRATHTRIHTHIHTHTDMYNITIYC